MTKGYQPYNIQRKRPTNEKLVEVYIEKHCNLRLTAMAVGYGRTQLQRWLGKDEKLQELFRQAKESMKDDLENVIWKKAIVDNDTTMQIFLAKCQLKDRGYIEKQEININQGGFKFSLGDVINVGYDETDQQQIDAPKDIDINTESNDKEKDASQSE